MSISGQPLDSFPSVCFDESGHLTEELPCYDLIGESDATRRLRTQIDRIGPHFRTVLVQGEMGTGKELVARALHARGRGAAGPFTICHGAALAEAVDGEYSRGGEDSGGAGSPWQLLCAARSGTVFVDGVDDMPLRAQSRLLDLLSAWSHVRATPRMIAATGQSLKKMTGTGRFRSDLYHRLATIEIAIEPLRRRRDDIPALAAYLVRRFASLYSKGTIAIADDVLERLGQYDWLGNVREMENVLRNAVLECDGGTVETRHLGTMIELGEPFYAAESPREFETVAKLQDVVEQHVRHVLRTCSGNKVRAADMLGISRSTLYRMLDNYSAAEDWQQV